VARGSKYKGCYLYQLFTSFATQPYCLHRHSDGVRSYTLAVKPRSPPPCAQVLQLSVGFGECDCFLWVELSLPFPIPRRDKPSHRKSNSFHRFKRLSHSLFLVLKEMRSQIRPGSKQSILGNTSRRKLAI